MNIGNELKRLRIKNGLTQEELADRCELSKGFISQVERDLASPSISTLSDLLQCLGTDLKNFFNDAADEDVVFKEDDVFVKEYKDEGSIINWIVPNSQKNDMEPILVEIPCGGKSFSVNPHGGEEFGYVLSGSVVIHIGSRTVKARKGESFYFIPNKNHYISANEKTGAVLIWVSTPPSF